jgi:hypothetical protein
MQSIRARGEEYKEGRARGPDRHTCIQRPPSHQLFLSIFLHETTLLAASAALRPLWFWLGGNNPNKKDTVCNVRRAIGV